MKSPTKKGIAGSVLQLLKGPKKDKVRSIHSRFSDTCWCWQDKKKRVFPKETSSPEGATTSPGQEVNQVIAATDLCRIANNDRRLFSGEDVRRSCQPRKASRRRKDGEKGKNKVSGKENRTNCIYLSIYIY